MALTRRVALLGASAVLAACSTTQTIRPVENHPHAFSPWSDTPPPYRLGAGDVIRVEFLYTPELSEQTVVGPDGYIALPVTGRISAQNLTPDQLQQAIVQAAGSNLDSPVVTVALLEAKSARIIVAGAVGRPGVFPLSPRATPLEAVTLAGGFLPEARMDEVVLLRAPPSPGPVMLKTVNLTRFVAQGDAEDRVALAPEDIVFVPRSHIAEVNLWIDENINKLLPFGRGVDFSYTLGHGFPY